MSVTSNMEGNPTRCTGCGDWFGHGDMIHGFGRSFCAKCYGQGRDIQLPPEPDPDAFVKFHTPIQFEDTLGEYLVRPSHVLGFMPRNVMYPFYAPHYSGYKHKLIHGTMLTVNAADGYGINAVTHVEVVENPLTVKKRLGIK